MPISPMATGATRPIMTAPLSRADGSIPNLTGLTNSAFTLGIYNATTKTSTTGGGTFGVVTPGTNGLVQYTWVASDTATVGNNLLTITVNYGAGQIETFGPVPWTVYQK